jgi:hypothetical protein
MIRATTLLVCGFLLAPVKAADLSGFVAGEVRYFGDATAHSDQLEGAQTSLILSPELRWRTDDRDRFSLIPYLRLDGRDNERSHADLREAYWLRVGSDWEWLIGINRVFWGVTESRHLVDIINQTDEIDAFDGEEKLGQPMINLTTRRDWGSLSLYILPGFRERTFSGREGRLRPAPHIDSDSAEYEASAEQRHTDLAIRYSHYLGDWDIGAYHFYGTSREPLVRPSADGERLVPFYELINQTGIDLQYTREAWLWKFEGIHRKSRKEHFTAVAAGFEYTRYQLAGSRADLGLLLEYLYDGRDANPTLAPPTPFDNDLFLGARLALNDVQDTSVLMGVVIDRDDRSRLFSIEAERRLGSHWTIELEARLFREIDRDSDLMAFENDSFLSLRAAYHL